MGNETNKKEDEPIRPGIPGPGEQPDQQQDPNAPPQPPTRGTNPLNRWQVPSTGNPDLDPVGLTNPARIDLRERDPMMPQGMLFDGRQLLDQHRGRDPGLPGLVPPPPGARFDPFGPPDPDSVGPGRGPRPGSHHQFGVPDPDHMPVPGMPELENNQQRASKTLKDPHFPPRRGPLGGPPGGAGGLGGGPPFL